MSGDEVTHGPPAGRPRDPQLDDAILQATRTLLVKVGYRRLAVDAVARLAGVSRTTLRLRWKSKAELVFDALSPDPEILRVPDTGSLEGDVRRCVENTVTLFRSAPMRAAFQGLLDDARNYPDVRMALWERIYKPSIAGFTALVRRGLARGEIATHVDPDVLFDIIAGSALYRLTVSGGDPVAMSEQLAALLIQGLSAANGPGATNGPGTASGPTDSASPNKKTSAKVSTKEQ